MHNMKLLLWQLNPLIVLIRTINGLTTCCCSAAPAEIEIEQATWGGRGLDPPPPCWIWTDGWVVGGVGWGVVDPAPPPIRAGDPQGGCGSTEIKLLGGPVRSETSPSPDCEG